MAALRPPASTPGREVVELPFVRGHSTHAASDLVRSAPAGSSLSCPKILRDRISTMMT